jgi:multiple sugar transport system permease protein
VSPRINDLLVVALRRLTLLGFAAVTLFPIYWMVSISLKRPVDALASPPIWFFTPTFDAYTKVLGDPVILGYFRNSLLVGLGTTVLSLAFGVPTAYVLARHRFRRRSDFAFWVLSTRMSPPVAMLIPFFIMYQAVGLQNTYLGLILMHVSMNLAIVIWVMRGFFADLPPELEEAALVDGASFWQTFIRIATPLAMPGMAATAILSFLFSWNEFLFALVLGGRDTRTTPVGLYNFIGYNEVQWPELSAAATIMLIPLVIVLLAFQRQLIRGLTLGAVRG